MLKVVFRSKIFAKIEKSIKFRKSLIFSLQPYIRKRAEKSRFFGLFSRGDQRSNVFEKVALSRTVRTCRPKKLGETVVLY
jgi:hypothetical protein